MFVHSRSRLDFRLQESFYLLQGFWFEVAASVSRYYKTSRLDLVVVNGVRGLSLWKMAVEGFEGESFGDTTYQTLLSW